MAAQRLYSTAQGLYLAAWGLDLAAQGWMQSILQDMLHIAGWLAGHRDPRALITCPLGGKVAVPGP